MDAFKILSRSTNLSKKRAPKAPTPSGGQKPHPQLFGDNVAADGSQSATTISKKRKRGQDAPTSADVIPDDLNFFVTDKRAGTSTKRTPTEEATEGATAPKTHTPIKVPELPYDDCKRLLRSHKIKIAQLWSPPAISTETGAEKKKKKKRQSQEAQTSISGPSKNDKKQKSELVVQPLTSFSHLRPRYGVPSALAENLEEQGYSMPTEIQLGALPLLLGAQTLVSEESGSTTPHATANFPGVLKYDVDLLSVAPTGSGKTLAFLIPVLAAILEQRRVDKQSGGGDAPYAGPKAIILAPTKELAIQITNEGRKLSRRTGIKVTMVKKGMNIVSKAQENSPKTQDGSEEDSISEQDEKEEGSSAKDLPPVKADVLISTPLTLLHAITSDSGEVAPLASVRYFVLDEADVLLDPLFRDQTLSLWTACTNPLLRVSLWSATMGSSIEDLACSTIAKRWDELEGLHPDATRPPLLRLIVGLKDTSLPTINHKLIYCGTEQGKLMALRNLIRPTTSSTDTPLRPPFLIFTSSIPRAVALSSELRYDIPASAGGSTRLAVLHADLTDTARENIMARFRRGEVWVLITTDLLSRGVDFRGLNGVVNYDFPSSSAVYVHRVGRTGRAGREGGVAVTLYAKDDVPYVKNVANVIAASERLHKGKGDSGEKGLQQWLLDALPTPTKREKQELKKRGVARSKDGKARDRISTKSGYERKVENNRKGAIEAAKARKIAASEGGQVQVQNVADDGFGGFDD